MKKLLALILVLAMVACLFVGCKKDDKKADDTTPATNEPVATGEEPVVTDPAKTADKSYRIAMITDYGDITDQSFNQTTYEACKAFCEENGLDFTYYKPTGDSTPERVAMVEAAVNEGYNVMVMPGYAFAGTITAVQDEYPDVKFIGLDVSEYDLEDSFYNHDENGNRTELIDASNEPHVSDNVWCAVYQEELAGYMAGYAAVKLGYKHLAFCGGMAVPAVIRYGYGFVQGADAAAVELNIADQVTIEYFYGNQFFGDADITAYMDTIYQQKNVEVTFACGGGIFTSVCEAAQKVDGAKVIGVDVDQSFNIDGKYGEGMTVTSAMKGLAATVKTALTDLTIEGAWDKYAHKVETLGLVSEDPAENYVAIPETTQFDDSFTHDNYLELVAKMFKGEVTVSNDTTAMPTTTITVNDLGNIK